MKIYLLPLLFIEFFLQSNLLAHPEKEFHERCLKASDYIGCINSFNLKSRSKSKIPDRYDDWRKYGPIQVNWSRWRSNGSSYVVPSQNAQGKPLFIALNCLKVKINVTGSTGEWKGWQSPLQEFEHNLISDLCESRN